MMKDLTHRLAFLSSCYPTARPSQGMLKQVLLHFCPEDAAAKAKGLERLKNLQSRLTTTLHLLRATPAPGPHASEPRPGLTAGPTADHLAVAAAFVGPKPEIPREGHVANGSPGSREVHKFHILRLQAEQAFARDLQQGSRFIPTVFCSPYSNHQSMRAIGSPAAAQTIQEAPREVKPKHPSSKQQDDQSLAEAQHQAEATEAAAAVKSGRHGDTTDMSYLMTQPSYDMAYLESIRPKHKPPEGVLEHMAMYGVKTGRFCFDKVSGYNEHKMGEKQWLRRILFLETIAGVPGMVGGMMRHMRSLRSMKRDNGWIHTLLEEAENERMHLLTFLELKQPSLWMRGGVLLAQGVFFNFYLLAYIISPRLCHSIVGYLEEEAVRTYTHAIKDIDEGRNPEWADKVAPDIAINYWKLGEGAKMRHLLLAVRADEAAHNHVNHVFASMDYREGTNPFAKNAHVMP
ncbi:hypothetical protein WJX84_004641 [Apatococcus fuscideae]|uniref:Ubiquinol oxidase n=1 Tax=Apatococcus fuscideae TaxID=2026836 RepID=A0AAW1SPT8_9CHLO